MAIENCLCEISKYLKCHLNKGRPKVKYPGIPEVKVAKKKKKRKRKKSVSISNKKMKIR